MTVKLNDTTVEVPEGTTLLKLLEIKGVDQAGTATAVNGVVVPRTERETTVLNPGDSVLVIKAMYGG